MLSSFCNFIKYFYNSAEVVSEIAFYCDDLCLNPAEV